MKTIVLTALLCLMLAQPALATPPDRVILIHGLGRTPLSMIWLQWNLQRAGYQVTNLRYPSHNPDALPIASANIDKAIHQPNQPAPGQIHFVTHSLGGIVLRNYLASHTLTNLGRVVMLAPPNQGSELADHLKRNWLGRLIIGPVGCQLGTTATDLPARLGPAHFPVGIIAADSPIIPWNGLVCKTPSDGIVSVASTKLDGMTDFLLVHGSHTLIMCRPDVNHQVQSFLKNGSFTPPKKQ